MNLPDPRKPKWGPWKPVAMLQEVLSHAGMLAFAWYGGLGYLGTVLVLAAEPLLITLLTALLYPQRGLARHAWDLAKLSFVSAVLLFFIYATYGVALAGGSADAEIPPVRLDPTMLGWAMALLVFHLGVILGYAWTTPRPRVVWSRLALNQGAVTFLALFFMVFVAAFIGPFAVQAVLPMKPELTAGDVASDVLVVLLVVLRLGIALLLTRMPEHELERTADNPYID
jgi:hypothetical protein